ncbi:MAG TPA: ligase-associated DNA damage response DEXH box helicase [Longimicrobiaceae bacterium]|nr:ligase-associated DNA damage response DEXH box helicase [Longimicrobiaceae bacterium]
MSARRGAGPLAPAEAWFAGRGWRPFPFQREVWSAYLAGESGLIHAATGTGKTYAAWWGPLLERLAEPPPEPRRGGRKQPAAEPLRVLWVTPLRALAADTAAALRAPLEELGLPWAVETRTGDTPAGARARQRRLLPTALVTTPESLTLLLTREDARELFRELRCVVVDEWHELLGGKRGVQTELALARLRRFSPGLRTWGVSATLGNLEEALRALLGTGDGGRVVRGLLPKPVVVDALIPDEVERFPWAGHLGTRMLPQVVEAVEEAGTSLLFTNTRSQTESWYRALLEARPDWAGAIALHHGSLDRGARDWVEAGLREGRLKCVVATSTLDLGVDFAPVERVLQLGSPKGVGRLLQRAGRSGHSPGRESRVTCIPTNVLELLEVAAAREAILAGRVESRPPAERPLDVLVQHLVTVALGGGFRAGELLEEVRSTHVYRELEDDEWRWALDFVTRGGPALTAYPEYSRVVERDGCYRVEDPRIARMHRMAVGTIVSDGQVQVRYLRGPALGSVEETFIARLRPGDRFVFGGKTLEFVRVRDMKAWVRRASGTRGTIPRWMGSRLSLSTELARAIRARLDEARRGEYRGPEMEAVRPVLELQARWSRIPAEGELLVERTRTREGHHLFVFPFEGRLVHEGLAALLAYRISRVRPISFTLAVNDYGLELLSPGPAPLEEALAAGLLSPHGLAEDVPAALNAAELARRQFREIARVAGLVFPGYPRAGKSARQLQASSGLFFDVLQRYDPGNRLLDQAHREVLERQLERSRLGRTLERLSAERVAVVETRRPTPLAFPLLVDRARQTVSSESLADRVRRMQLPLERAADREAAAR